VLVKNLLKPGGTMNKLLLTFSLIFFFTLPLLAQSVDTAWVRRYNGPGNYEDVASAISVDGSGNIYVTGQSLGSGTGYDYATIKYYPNGDTAWVRRYNGPENNDDAATAIAVDDSGRVYVTGVSGDWPNSDYATIKYYPNGDTAWVRRYNGTGNSYDAAYSIAVDDSANVYVTGDSWSGGVTIKYYPNGDTAWVRQYSDHTNAIAVDDSGNVYVTGLSWGSGTDNDYATIKYYPNGDTAWVRRYNGPGNGWDWAHSIAVDGSNNIYVTGESSGGTDYDYATIKYYPNGDTAWVRRYNGPGNGWDYARALAVDDSGNVYVTGDSPGSGTDYDYTTIKYRPNGDTAWVRRYNGPGNGGDYARAIAIDGSNNIYVTGESNGWTYYDYATIKYYPNGDTAWVIRYNGPESSSDGGYAIALDDSNNVYVTGYSHGSGTDLDYATIKYIQFLRGDCNKDGNIRLVDVILLADYVLKGGPAPTPLQSGDVNCDSKYDLVDVIKLARHVLLGEPFTC
jgi:hypothetical protein